MDIIIILLLWVHLLSLGLGGTAAFGISVVGSKMPTAAPEARPTLLKIMHDLSTVGRIGIGLLIVTGPLMIWLKYGGFDGMNTWFWIKMVLVLLLLATVTYSGILFKRVQAGDQAAAKLSPRVGRVSMLTFVAIIFSAAFAFG